MTVSTIALAAILSAETTGALAGAPAGAEIAIHQVPVQPVAAAPNTPVPALSAAASDAGVPPISKAPAGTESLPAAPAEDQPAKPGTAQTGDKQPGEDIVVQGAAEAPPEDPLQEMNVETFEVVQAVDKALVEPIAHGYMKAVPKPVRKGLHNVLTNLDEPIVFLSFLLQLKPLKALETLGRFGINSTLGLGGIIDIARREPFYAPHQRNGFAHVLAYYGVKPGPFLYLPLIGSTTVRDLFGRFAEMPVLPLAIGKPFDDPYYVFPKAALSAIDDRAQDDERIQEIHAQSSNPYAAYRSYYLRKRQAEVDVLKGLRDNSDVPIFEDEALPPENAEPAGPGAAPAQDDSTPASGSAVPDALDLSPSGEPQLPVDSGAMLVE